MEDKKTVHSAYEVTVYVDSAGNTISLAVKCLDQQTKATQVSQFDLTLEKNGDNWKIIK